MGKTFSQHEEVANDLTEIYDFIAFERFEPDAARRVVAAINGTIRKIRMSPEQFSRYSPKTFRHESLYKVVVNPFSNYLVFYELTDEEVRILYVHHAAREFESRHLQEQRR